MNCHLSIFCLKVHETLSNLRGEEKLKAFLKYRYRILLDEYPHEPFSVEQGDYDFFEVTAKYLSGELDVDKIVKSDYNNNYIGWIKLHKQTK